METESLSEDLSVAPPNGECQQASIKKRIALTAISITLAIAELLHAGTPKETVLWNDVDLVEINHYYDEQGGHVFDQTIFYDWSSENCRYDVRAYRLSKNGRQMPVTDEGNGNYNVLWHDRQYLRKVRAAAFRETWTQYDPELIERDILPQDQRRELTRPKPQDPLPDLPHASGNPQKPPEAVGGPIQLVTKTEREPGPSLANIPQQTPTDQQTENTDDEGVERRIVETKEEWLASPQFEAKLEEAERISRAFDAARTPRDMREDAEQFVRSVRLEIANPLPPPLMKRLLQAITNGDFRCFVNDNLSIVSQEYPLRVLQSDNPVRADIVLDSMQDLLPCLIVDPDVRQYLQKHAIDLNGEDRHHWKILVEMCSTHQLIIREPGLFVNNIPNKISIRLPTENDLNIKYTYLDGNLSLTWNTAIIDPATGESATTPETKEKKCKSEHVKLRLDITRVNSPHNWKGR